MEEQRLERSARGFSQESSPQPPPPMPVKSGDAVTGTGLQLLEVRDTNPLQRPGQFQQWERWGGEGWFQEMLG